MTKTDTKTVEGVLSFLDGYCADGPRKDLDVQWEIANQQRTVIRALAARVAELEAQQAPVAESNMQNLHSAPVVQSRDEVIEELAERVSAECFAAPNEAWTSRSYNAGVRDALAVIRATKGGGVMFCRFKGMISPKLYLYYEGFLNIRDRKSAWLAIYLQERRGSGAFKGYARRQHFAAKLEGE